MPLPLIALLAGMGAVAGGGAAIGASRREGKERNPLLDSPDAETIDPDTDGAFSSFLEAIGRPGKMVNNALIGNWEGVGRQGVDLLGDVADAILPGDEIKHISRRMDKPEFSDVVGGMDPGLGKFAVDVLGGAATDPTMLLPTGAISKVGGAAGELLNGGIKAADKLIPGTAEKVANAGRLVRSTFGAVPDAAKPFLDAGKAGQLEGAAGLGAIKAGALAKLSDEEASVVGDIMDNLKWGDGKAGLLADEGTSALERIASHPGVTPENQGRITDAINQIIEIGQNQAKRPGIFWKAKPPAAPTRGTAAPAPVPSAPVAPIKSGPAPAWTKLVPPEAPEDLAGMTADQLEASGHAWKEHDDALIKGIFGKRMTGKALQDAVDNLPIDSAEYRALTSGVDHRDLFDLARNVRNAEGVTSADDIGRILGNRIYKLVSANEKSAADWLPSEVEAAAMFRAASRSAADNGIKPEAINQAIGAWAARYGHKPGDIADLLASAKRPAASAAITGPAAAEPEVPRALGGPTSLLGDLSGAAKETAAEAVELPSEYLGRTWTGQTEEQRIAGLLGLGPEEAGASNAAKELVLKTPDQINDFVAKNPGMSFERNAVKRMAKRAEAQGAMASRAEIGKMLVGDGFTLADKASRKAAVDTIKQMAAKDPETAKVVLDAFSGMAPRGAVTSFLAKANVPFKRAAVAGFLIPKFGADVRNRLSGIVQTFANPETRGATGGMALRTIQDIGASVSDALGMKMGSDRFTKILSDWEDALSKSGGSAETALEIMRQTQPKAAEVIANGALDGYSRAEDLITALKESGWKGKARSAVEFPQRIMRGLEDRMRLGLAMDLVDQGKAPAEAASLASDALYRYGSTSVANRNARDAIPFFQFSAKAIPQQAKLLAEKPALATGLSRAMSSADDPDAPIYPYMAGKLNIPLGLDEQGNQQFVSGMGLPFEALNSIPDVSNGLGKLGRSLERDTLGAAHPLLKTAFGAVSGEDPYFESGFGSYGKVPLLGEAGAAGRAYNVAAGTGLLQPFDSPARLLGQVFDERRTPGTKAIDLLTGANVVNVDPDRALQQQLQDELERNPTVNSYRSFYQSDKDPETQAMLHRYQDAKHRAKVKRDAEHAQAQAADVL